MYSVSDWWVMICHCSSRAAFCPRSSRGRPAGTRGVRTRTAVALAAENRTKLRSFFLALLDFTINVMARSDGDISATGMRTAYALRGPLLDLANEFPEDATSYFLELLQDLGPETAPKARELSALKLIPLIFPTTDFQHPVVTPATLLADHWALQLAQLGENIQELVSEGTMWPGLKEMPQHTAWLPGHRLYTQLTRVLAGRACCASYRFKSQL